MVFLQDQRSKIKEKTRTNPVIPLILQILIQTKKRAYENKGEHAGSPLHREFILRGNLKFTNRGFSLILGLVLGGICFFQKNFYIRSEMRNNQISLGDAIKEWISEKRLNEPILEMKIVEAWHRLMPEPITKHTKDIKFRNGKLYITVSLPALKQELFYSRITIADTFNQEIKTDVIQEVIIY